MNGHGLGRPQLALAEFNALESMWGGVLGDLNGYTLRRHIEPTPHGGKHCIKPLAPRSLLGFAHLLILGHATGGAEDVVGGVRSLDADVVSISLRVWLDLRLAGGARSIGDIWTVGRQQLGLAGIGWPRIPAGRTAWPWGSTLPPCCSCCR